MENKTLLEKAVITTDAIATAGKLNPKQAEKFIDYVIDETVFKGNTRIVKFRNESMEIDKIGVGTRVTYPKSEAADTGIRNGVSHSKITLTPHELLSAFEISENYLEENIEGSDVEDVIIRMMATQVGNDIESLTINGNTVGPAITESDWYGGLQGSTTDYVKDRFMALFDGWLRQGDSANVYDAAGAAVGLSGFSGMLRQMPTKFRRNKKNLRWFMSPDFAMLYAEKLSTRSTVLGDAAAGGFDQSPFGIPIVQVPLMDLLPKTVVHATMTGTVAQSLGFAPVSSVVVSTSTLDSTPETPYVETTDYTVDYTNGTITRVGGGSITTGQVVKVTFDVNPQVLLTHYMNFIIAIGRDITIESQRDIYKGTNQYAITTKIDAEFEESTAVVKGKNFSSTL